MIDRRESLLSFAALAAMIVAAPAMAKGGLHVDVYNPGDKALFAVSSSIVSGPTEMVLIDAQMRRADAAVLVAKIRATRKRLKAVYVSQSDPDFYFGLETIRAAFPRVPIVATPQTIAAIDATKAGKLAYWGPKLKENAPTAVIVPQALQGDTLTVDGEALKIVGLDGPTPDRTFVWIPSARTVVGGTIIVANEHVFMADTQSPRSRADWRTTLARVEALKPATVVPGHYHPEPRRDRTALPGLGPLHPRLSGRLRGGSRPERRLAKPDRRDDGPLPRAGRSAAARDRRQGHQARDDMAGG